MTVRLCALQGHVTVDDDLECLICGALISLADRVGLHINRPGGDLENDLSIASISEWGPANVNPD